jgi:hypothetical protein
LLLLMTLSHSAGDLVKGFTDYLVLADGCLTLSRKQLHAPTNLKLVAVDGSIR